jgi:hypothetical protein
MKTELKVIFGLLVISGILEYIFKSTTLLYYVILPFVGLMLSYFITDAKNEGKIDIFKISIWIGSAALILSGVILMVTKTTSDLLAVIVFVGVLSFMISFFSYIGMEEPKDERLRKIGGAAATHSWHITLLIVCGLLVSSIWSGDKYISISSLGLILLVMVATMISGNIYFNWKGDVE